MSIRILFVIAILMFQEASASFESAADLYKANNFPAAFVAFTELAEAGDARAQTVLALMYKYGEGTKVNSEKALKWYQTAAEQGYAPAQFHTGSLYAEGLEDDASLQKAEYWFSKAAKQGFARANDRLSNINPETEKDAEIKVWSTDWDLRLPNTYRLNAKTEALKPPNEQYQNDPYRVQVGAMLSQSSANKLWSTLKQAHPTLLKNLQPTITLSQNPKKRVYRIQTGPFSNFRNAKAFCDTLLDKALNAGCLVIKQN